MYICIRVHLDRQFQLAIIVQNKIAIIQQLEEKKQDCVVNQTIRTIRSSIERLHDQIRIRRQLVPIFNIFLATCNHVSSIWYMYVQYQVRMYTSFQAGESFPILHTHLQTHVCTKAHFIKSPKNHRNVPRSFFRQVFFLSSTSICNRYLVLGHQRIFFSSKQVNLSNNNDNQILAIHR